MPQADNTQDLIKQANALIKQINDDQERIDGFYRAENLNPDKIAEFADKHLNEQIENEARQMVELDLASIEEEVNKEANRLSAEKSFTDRVTPPNTIMI